MPDYAGTCLSAAAATANPKKTTAVFARLSRACPHGRTTMQYIEETITQEPYGRSSWSLYAKGLSIAFLDIETTGLSPARDSIALGGLLSQAVHDKSGLHLKQYLAASTAEEGSLLAQYTEALSNAQLWISYNGDSFDLPFLVRRLQRAGIADGLPLFLSIDLYRLLRRYWPMAKLLPNMKQSTVEASLGLQDGRTDAITGGEIAALYRSFAPAGSRDIKKAQMTESGFLFADDAKRTGGGNQGVLFAPPSYRPEIEGDISCEIKKTLLLHNRNDLLQLSRILPIMDKLDLHRIMFENGFLVGSEAKRLLIRQISAGSGVLKATGRSQGLDKDSDAYFDGFQWSHRGAERSFTLSLPCFREKDSLYVDLEALGLDFSPLETSPAFVSGYLLLSSGHRSFFREINYMIKIILTEILNIF